MKKRLFVAITLPKSMQDAFAEYKKNFKLNDVRWTAKENLHITVFFLGNIRQNLIPNIVNVLQKATAGIKPFTLKFEKVSFAPLNQPPRMIWGQFYKNNEYTHLTRSVSKTLNQLLQISMKNAFRENIPHVTLARIKNPNSVIGTQLKPTKIENLTVASYQLIESNLFPNGSTYLVIKKFILER